MEMCARKYMFGDESTFGSSQNGQNMPKKVNKNFFLYIKQGSITYVQFHKVASYVYANIEIQICLGTISASKMREWFRVWNRYVLSCTLLSLILNGLIGYQVTQTSLNPIRLGLMYKSHKKAERQKQFLGNYLPLKPYFCFYQREDAITKWSLEITLYEVRLKKILPFIFFIRSAFILTNKVVFFCE